MAQAENSGELGTAALMDEATQLKKRARRRLIGAAALALLAAIVLPMTMDHEPAPPIKDIQVRIPSPDEGMTQRIAAGTLAAPAPKEVVAKDAAEVVPPENRPVPAPVVAPPQPVKPEDKPVAKAEPKPAAKPEPERATAKAAPVAANAAAGQWEVQLGAYQNPVSVTNLVGKLKQLGVPTYTEKIETPNGPRTRVRAGPFASQEDAEKARVRVRIVGVDGPVARKP
ncbi:MAG: SPOR domain-containing protein [Pseudomonadota bacterium]